MNNGEDNIYWLLIQLANRARHDFARISEGVYGLTTAQMQTLCLLPADSAIPMNVLSCQMSCDASNVTGIADRLEAQGLVERKDDPNDRRIKMLSVTTKGRTLRQRILRDLSLAQPSGLTNLTAQEREQFLRLLDKALAPPSSS
ncbi:MAG TPA: MarR family winged helix-turn-helix transcriptional regulator [Candidatus Saccharimonadales bacterium]|nr:MarR family winged helix-turn-helix transcriptional regulator [Candidatus Saccharimonadales bacterium]